MQSNETEKDVERFIGTIDRDVKRQIIVNAQAIWATEFNEPVGYDQRVVHTVFGEIERADGSNNNTTDFYGEPQQPMERSALSQTLKKTILPIDILYYHRNAGIGVSKTVGLH